MYFPKRYKKRPSRDLPAVEAKWCNEELDKHGSQLFRYFAATEAKFGILTNGLFYKFYTDLEEPNKMDEKPFMEFSILDIKDSWVNELKKFQKSVLNIDDIFTAASELKYSNLIKSHLYKQLNEPDDNFINYILGEVYEGKRTKSVIDKFRDIVKKAYNQFLNETMNERIKVAIGQASSPEKTKKDLEDTAKAEAPPPKIITTQEELEHFYAIKSILHNVVDPERLFYRDTESYIGILLDDNKLKWICRLSLDSNKKSIVIPDENKKQTRYPLDSIDTLYKMSDKLIESVKRFID